MDFAPILESLRTAGGLFWKAFWALALGYAFSALIQVFIARRAAAQKLGRGSPGQLALAAALGFISSSCSFAALSATRSLFAKGAALTSSLAFMFASTNLAIEVAALAYIFLGWQYSVALFVGAPILILIQSILVRLTASKKLTEKALARAREISSGGMDPSENLPEKLGEKIRAKKTWLRVGGAYLGEWKMVYREIALGFLIAGFVATLVPAEFFQMLFPTNLPSWLLLPLQALLAPILAIITIIGSMGNGPLAAILANNGILFGAIMAFLFADFNVPPAIKINAKYYGWPFAFYLAAITAASAILAGIAVHLIFGALGILPTGAKNFAELTTFRLDYTFWLNLFAIIVAIILLFLSRKARKMEMHHH